MACELVLTQFLAKLCQLGRRGVTCLEVAARVLHEVREGDPSMRSDHAVVDLMIFEQLDQIRPGYVQQVSCLLGGQHGVVWHDLDALSPGQHAEHLCEHHNGSPGNDERLVDIPELCLK